MSKTAALHVKNAPSPRLVFTYLGAGVLSFFVLGALTVLGFREWNGFFAATRLLGWVHVAVLLWLNLIVFGVLFQFVPVVLNVRLGSEKLAWAQLFFYLPGAIGMAAAFWIGRLDWPLHAFATVLWVGFFLFIWNMLVTYRKVTAWTLTARCIYAAVLYLLATIMLGLFLSIHLAYPMGSISHLTLLKLHAHFGLVGWLLMLVMGISMKLLPMFLLSHNYSTRPGEAAFYLVNAGLLAWSLGVVLDWPGWARAISAGVLAIGVICYLAQAFTIFRKRNKLKSDPHRRHTVRRMEFPLRFAACAYGVLAAAVLTGAALAVFWRVIPVDYHNQLVLVYGALIFLGFFSLLTQSFLYKIVPFLVWLTKFSNTAGRVKTPRIETLAPRKAAVAQLTTYCVGTALIALSLALSLPWMTGAGGALVFVSAGWLPCNLISIWFRAVPLGAIERAPSCEAPPEPARQRVQ